MGMPPFPLITLIIPDSYRFFPHLIARHFGVDLLEHDRRLSRGTIAGRARANPHSDREGDDFRLRGRGDAIWTEACVLT